MTIYPSWLRKPRNYCILPNRLNRFTLIGKQQLFYLLKAPFVAPFLPLMAWQGKQIRKRVPRLPEATHPQGKISEGEGNPLVILGIGESTMAGVGVTTHTEGFMGSLASQLNKEIDRPIFAPIVVSIEDFVTELSGIEKVSPIELQLLFYHVYKKNTPQEERHSLYQFSKWAPSLLNEFSEIDSQLVEADRLFEFMSAVEQIEQWDPKDKETLSSHFFKFQKRIPAYYKQLYTALLKQNNAYSGMQFREATKNLGNYLQATSAFHYFIGFNALTLAEETIIQEKK